MPAFYAHYRFGREMLQKLPPETRALCEQHRDLFDIGLHGPDIFFFYHPLKKNPVSEFGHQCHSRSGREFLSAAETVIAAADDKDAARAYFYGFLCHLALDSVCHPGVYEAQKYTGASHIGIETALDRALLLSDGIEPLAHDPCGHFHITKKNAGIIAAFFPPHAPAVVEKSLRAMVLFGRLLYCGKPVIRKPIEFLLRITGHYDSLSPMLMTAKPDPRCRESDRRLQALFPEAVSLAAELIAETDIYIESKTGPGAVFDRTFKGPM